MLSNNPDYHGAMLTTVVLGADKTTVSVATGHQEYHPVYMSMGNLHNEMRRAHRDAVIPLAFLAIPKRESRVSEVSLHALLTLMLVYARWSRQSDRRVPHFRQTTLSHGSSTYSRPSAPSDDDSSYHAVPRWTLPTLLVRARPVHRRLPGTSVPRWHRLRVVSQVRTSP